MRNQIIKTTILMLAIATSIVISSIDDIDAKKSKCNYKPGGFWNEDRPLIDMSGQNCNSILGDTITNLFGRIN